jgi:hypothetical protein
MFSFSFSFSFFGGKILLSYLACIWLNLLLLLLDHNSHFGYITKLTKTAKTLPCFLLLSGTM